MATSGRSRLTRPRAARPPPLLDLPPGHPPVGVRRVPREHVAHGGRMAALGRDGAERPLHQPSRARLEERCRIQARHEQAAIQPVPARHEPAHPRCVAVGLRGEARGHQADEIRLDLGIDVVRVQVVPRIAGALGPLALRQQPTRGRVRVEQVMSGPGERRGMVGDRGVEAALVHHPDEGGIDVEIVLRERVLHLPGREPTKAFDDRPAGAELKRCPAGDADHLPGPAAADLVLEDREREAPEAGEIGCRLVAGRIGRTPVAAEDEANEEQRGPGQDRGSSHVESVGKTAIGFEQKGWFAIIGSGQAPGHELGGE